MKMYRILIRMVTEDNKVQWNPMKRSDGRIYEYETKEEAEKIVYICDYNNSDDVKIKKL